MTKKPSTQKIDPAGAEPEPKYVPEEWMYRGWRLGESGKPIAMWQVFKDGKLVGNPLYYDITGTKTRILGGIYRVQVHRDGQHTLLLTKGTGEPRFSRHEITEPGDLLQHEAAALSLHGYQLEKRERQKQDKLWREYTLGELSLMYVGKSRQEKRALLARVLQEITTEVPVGNEH